MVKLIRCISKLPHLSNEEFHRYWRDVHGPIARGIPGCRKYVQSHTIHRALNGIEPSFDGIAELWFDDWLAPESGLATKEAAVAFDDGRKFIDDSRGATLITEEHLVI